MSTPKIIRFKLTNGDTFGIFLDNLNKYPDTFLSKLVTNEGIFHSRTDFDGDCFVLDEHSQIFDSILQFYRYGILELPDRFDSVKQDIIDKYLLPVELVSNQLSSEKIPFYITVHDCQIFGKESGVLTTTGPPVNTISELMECPFSIMSDVYIKTHYMNVVNYLSTKGYIVELWSGHEHATVMMKKMK
ncbi:unnamed protein product [Didymodactylos carnosus]|uniref:Potassium channel tetramerisation-type BTB domain-containing protein n=1 Tax=Didymodactylos carnosus TaxID=1234261 RepID=A0A815JXR5_9BILA|nr:unnamed protein product [Didymodactylos carnosus]CAF4280913.1 unnamed protein product [Didymodactylos carnosus]